MIFIYNTQYIYKRAPRVKWGGGLAAQITKDRVHKQTYVTARTVYGEHIH